MEDESTFERIKTDRCFGWMTSVQAYSRSRWIIGYFYLYQSSKGLTMPSIKSSLVIDISLLNCLLKLTDINLFTGCVVCNGFYKLKSMTYVIYVYVLFSYIQHGREVVVNINIDFRFYVCFQTKPKSFVSYI